MVPGGQAVSSAFTYQWPCSMYSDLVGWELWCAVTQQVGRIYPQGGARFWACLPGWQGPLLEISLVPVPSRWPQRGTRDSGPTSSSQTEEQRTKWPVNISYKHTHSSHTEEQTGLGSQCGCVCVGVYGVCLCVSESNQINVLWNMKSSPTQRCFTDAFLVHSN